VQWATIAQQENGVKQVSLLIVLTSSSYLLKVQALLLVLLNVSTVLMAIIAQQQD
jgi:hypothetical protein